MVATRGQRRRQALELLGPDELRMIFFFLDSTSLCYAARSCLLWNQTAMPLFTNHEWQARGLSFLTLLSRPQARLDALRLRLSLWCKIEDSLPVPHDWWHDRRNGSWHIPLRDDEVEIAALTQSQCVGPTPEYDAPWLAQTAWVPPERWSTYVRPEVCEVPLCEAAFLRFEDVLRALCYLVQHVAVANKLEDRQRTTWQDHPRDTHDFCMLVEDRLVDHASAARAWHSESAKKALLVTELAPRLELLYVRNQARRLRARPCLPASRASFSHTRC